uniref:Uncharacterized protein n=1 Tax=Pipistrellus kuhlii TaxID=59472 RepID=A0A7J8A7X7_PIPKU|nr:hypothetical protein mPipKuh1_008959 [Pipistrellus kuhlii]
MSLREPCPPPGGPPRRAARSEGFKGAGPPLALRSPGSSRGPRCRPRLPPPPPPRPPVGSWSCGGGSQLLHIWLLLHIYILERASELASERERARGREEGGGRGGSGGRRRRRRERSIPQTSFLLQWRSRSRAGPVSLRGDPKQAPGSSRQSHRRSKTLFLSLCPPFPTPPQIHLHFTEHRAASHQGGLFRLQTPLSSLYSTLLLSRYREVRYTSGHRECWWTSLLAPRSSLEVHGTWCLCCSKHI